MIELLLRFLFGALYKAKRLLHALHASLMVLHRLDIICEQAMQGYYPICVITDEEGYDKAIFSLTDHRVFPVYDKEDGSFYLTDVGEPGEKPLYIDDFFFLNLVEGMY